MKNLLILSFIVALAFSLTIAHEKSPHDEVWKSIPWDSETLGLEELTESDWIFSNDGGVLGYPNFEENGQVTNFNQANEKTWKFDNTGALCFVAANGQVSTRFAHAYRDFYGRWHLEGRFAFANNGWRHYLIQKDE